MTNAKTKTTRRSNDKSGTPTDVTQSDAETVVETSVETPQPTGQSPEVTGKAPADITQTDTGTDDQLPVETQQAEPCLLPVEVKATKKTGFWRCGRFWSSEGSHAFVVPDDADIRAIRLENPDIESVFLTEAEYQRLKNEPALSVKQLEAGIDTE
ncbi:hypothetical protein RND59_05465 [Vibrio ruber]|uniref:hypothetical protein n=1 Tax=Vibrio ruber TaxID=184755 RepID=UPI002892DBFD|nr:hypothetical protein [Vibrio ruber]WNJ96544.1 hypothetical protein RND59_05465 [Vibrio ruber]